MIGLMLLFAVMTLIPGGAALFRFGRRGRGMLYLFLGLVSGFFSALSFLNAASGFLK
jgi:hypothetical protein